jgi:DNA-binding XRE family transcriptional regulator
VPPLWANVRGMDLREYLNSERAAGLTMAGMARELGIARGHLHDISARRRQPSLPLALAIERLTGGLVGPRDLLRDGPAEVAE